MVPRAGRASSQATVISTWQYSSDHCMDQIRIDGSSDQLQYICIEIKTRTVSISVDFDCMPCQFEFIANAMHWCS